MKQIIAQICKVLHVCVFSKRKGRHGIVINTPGFFYFINGEVLNSRGIVFISSIYNRYEL